MGKYIFRLDDIAPNMDWENYFKIRKIFLNYNIKPIVGVIPDNQDSTLKEYPLCSSDFWSEVRKMQEVGWSIALHGYQHVFDSNSKGILGLNCKSEFAGHSYELQSKKIKNAIEIFTQNGVTINAFMAPSHSFDQITLRIIKEHGINCVTDGYGLFPNLKDEIVFVPQLFARPKKFIYGVYTFCLHLNVMKEKDITELELFINNNYNDIISFSDAYEYVVSSKNFTVIITNLISKYLLKSIRSIRNVFQK